LSWGGGVDWAYLLIRLLEHVFAVCVIYLPSLKSKRSSPFFLSKSGEAGGVSDGGEVDTEDARDDKNECGQDDCLKNTQGEQLLQNSTHDEEIELSKISGIERGRGAGGLGGLFRLVEATLKLKTSGGRKQIWGKVS
jgi:hypothetical protein